METLTLTSPYWQNDSIFHTEDDSCDDDSSKAGLWNESTVWHHHSQAQDDEPTCDNNDIDINISMSMITMML